MIKFLCGLLITGALIFVPAGTLAYRQGLLLVAVLFIPMFVAGLFMMKVSPELLKKRLKAKEEQDEQKTVIKLSALMFVAAFVAAGLSYRFDFLMFPELVSYIAVLVFLSGYAMYAEVLRENAYLSRTIEVQEGQKVVDTGLYGIVRHPMYLSTLLLFFSMPVILGSVISLVIMTMYIPVIAKRIRNEEKVLEAGLEGYADYKKRVKHKVIPFIW